MLNGVRVLIVSMVWILALAAAGPAVHADCGSIPYRSPLDLVGDFALKSIAGATDVSFDPMEVVVYEPGQRAIILWNGEEQILLLSTDIRTSEPVSILEVIPFPAEPEVRLGKFETFEKMQRLLIHKTMWRVASGGGAKGVQPPASAAEITFHKQMGAHNVAVVRVLDEAGFLKWVNGYLQQRQATSATIDPNLARIIQRYVDSGYEWFVFDSIQTADSLQSRQPIEYRFACDSVYYPLEISSRETGKTNIDLLTLTKQPLTRFPDFQFSLKEDVVSVKQRELLPIRKEWAAFMDRDEFSMQRIRIRGNIQEMTRDFIAR